MMTHDPFQNYQTLGAYPGAASPFGLPYTAFQSPFNPVSFTGQPLHNPVPGGYGFYPQQTHGAGLTGQPGIPQQLLALNPFAGLQNPYVQQHMAQNPWQQQALLASGVQSPLQNPALAYNPWQQQQQPFPYPLAPQSMIGAGGIGQTPLPQINPLAQLALRQAGYGINPLIGF
jgi:hypothetical protein